MLSAGLKNNPTTASLGYQGKKLTPADVRAIHKTAQDIVHQLSTLSSPLVLFVGNSLSYVYQALSPLDIATYNIHNIPVSGGLPHISPALASRYIKHVLEPILSKPFKHVVLVDIYGTGASKDEFAHLLAVCEQVLKYPKGTLSPVQIPILDKNKGKARPSQSGPVKFLSHPVIMEVPGLAHGLTNGDYPRITPNYPTSNWNFKPEVIAQKTNLDSMGRLEIINTIKGVPATSH